MRFSRRGTITLFILLGSVAAVAFFHDSIFWAAGAMLVHNEPPRKADLVVVLAGDSIGYRVTKGAQLVNAGYAPKLFLSNGRKFYGLDESEAAADFLVRHGFDRDRMILFHQFPNSTEEEAKMVIPDLLARGVHSILLVTSDYHSARANRIFQRHAQGIEIHTVAAPDRGFCGGYWWKRRECQKTWFFEEIKTITGPFGI